jgi:hypothetical protein
MAVDWRVVLTSGEVVELHNAELVKDEPMLVFRCGRAEYRFNWRNVAYYVERRRG